MNNIEDILKAHNLSLRALSSLLRIGAKVVYCYNSDADRVKPENRKIIEKGLKILENNPDLIAPKLDGKKEYIYSWYEGVYNLHSINMAKFDKKFRALYESE